MITHSPFLFIYPFLIITDLCEKLECEGLGFYVSSISSTFSFLGIILNIDSFYLSSQKLILA